eukprot:2581115-Rhodomonas_salina.1
MPSDITVDDSVQEKFVAPLKPKLSRGVPVPKLSRGIPVPKLSRGTVVNAPVKQSSGFSPLHCLHRKGRRTLAGSEQDLRKDKEQDAEEEEGAGRWRQAQ